MADISSGTVSLKTIAVECGVSVSTASRALSVPPLGKISPAVREKIIACAKKYGYTGNPNARSLRIKKHESITLVLPPFFTQKPLYIDFDAHVRLNHWELIFSVIQKAREYGYDVKLEPLQTEKDLALLEPKLSKLHSDGAIFIISDFFQSLFPRLQQEDFPFIGLNFTSSASPTTLFIDIESGYREAVDFLRKTGRTNIAFCMEPSQVHGKTVMNVLKHILDEYDLFRPENNLMIPDLSALRKLAEGNIRGRYDAFFCLNDDMAFQFKRELRYRDIRIPEEIALIGYDNNPVYSDISTIGVPRAAMAEKAVELLIGHLQNRLHLNEIRETKFPTYFISRSTT